MLAEISSLVILGSLVVGPLFWRLHQDRRREQALAIRADLHSALVRVLNGDSLVAVEVEAPTLRHAGRVVLSAPADWAWLLEPAWDSVAAHVPAGYELVVRPVGSRRPAPIGEDRALPRAA